MEKLSPWDSRSIESFFQKAWDGKSIFCLSTFDSFIERLMLNHAESLKPFRIMSANEIKSDWMNENALNMDLFASLGESENYVILDAEQLNAEVQEVFVNYANNLTKKFLLLFKNGNKSGAKFVNKLLKAECSMGLTIEAPKFWDYNKYFLFYLESLGCTVDASLNRVSFQGKDMGSSEIAQFAISLSQESGSSTLTYEQVQKVLDKKAEDVFSLVKKLTAKDWNGFYQALDKVSHDADQFRSGVIFLQKHFMKVKYPMTYIKGNRKPTKFDQEIERVGRMWQKSEIDNVLNLLSDFEMLSKMSPKELPMAVRDKLVQIKKGEQRSPFDIL